MNTLLDPVRQAVRDLVQKKLWPVAALLVAAIVAVPVVLGGSPEQPAPAPLASSTPASPGPSSLVSVVDQPVTGKEDRPGKIEDPFYDPPPKKDPAADAAAAAGASPAKPGTGPAAGGTGGTTQTPVAPSVAPHYFRTVARFSSRENAAPVPLERLAPLGGLVEPAVLYLGVTRSSGGTYAVFLLGPKAVSEGEARCNDEACRIIGLKRGEKQLVTVDPDGGDARQYYVQPTSIASVTASADDASSMRHKVHADGRDVMREMWSDGPTSAALGQVQYNADLGLLIGAAGAPATAATAGE